jgi:chromosome segregation protein
VHLKKLEIFGFKSFGFKNTVLTFDKGLIAVTGPNGSGKSNILDAIMFALGENSPKILRVDRFQSLFHDTQNIRNKMVHVGLSFDNFDRGIPIDADTVTLTRDMEGQTGDSEYSLNGKKVTKGTIVELLEIVIATSNKLNIVQQGMITRISELNTDERRKIIEDIVGLSYFDEKKNEALNHLDESDRRLEIAFARIDEVRKRIDELEIERNEQMKYLKLESEIKRYRAIKISNTIGSNRSKIGSLEKQLDNYRTRSLSLEDEISKLRSEIEEIEHEKAAFMKESDTINKNKALIGSKLSDIVYASERNRAILKEANQRVSNIEKRLNSIQDEKEVLKDKLSMLNKDLEEVESTIQSKRSEVRDLTSELNSTNKKLDMITSSEGIYHTKKATIDRRLNILLRIQSQLEVVAGRLQERHLQLQKSISRNKIEVGSLRNELFKLNFLSYIQNKDLQGYLQSLQIYSKSSENLLETKKRFEQDLTTSSQLITTAHNAVSLGYEDMIHVVRNPNTEYFALTNLLRASEYFGIVGLVQDIIKFERVYERAVFAAASDWMKAIVVSDIQSMISILRYSMHNRLPRFRIIPLDILKSHSKKYGSCQFSQTDGIGILGRLDSFVNSEYTTLVTFLFGDVILVRTSSDGYKLAKKGFKSVSLSGISFEPTGVQVSIDFGSELFDLSKTILIADVVGRLESSTNQLKSVVEKRKSNLELVVNDLSKLEQAEFRAETSISGLRERISFHRTSQYSMRETLKERICESQKLQDESKSIEFARQLFEFRLAQSKTLIGKLASILERIHILQGKQEFANLNNKKSDLLKAIERGNLELGEKITGSTPTRSMLHSVQQQLNDIYEEEQQLLNELRQKRDQSGEMQKSLEVVESEILSLRQQEQEIIDSSGKSYEVLSGYEQKIKLLAERERKFSRENSILERDIAISNKDTDQLRIKNQELSAELKSLDHEEIPQDIDVDAIIDNLNEEYNSLRSRVNLRAVDAYSEIIEGYRSMSERRNDLEVERNSIVEFIEEISKEKRQVFEDAFFKVDQNIRQTFAAVTGGSAWLELENPDEETSGIMLVVQFPDKPRRESTSLSGGEKTMAATVFLLALQSLKPSPFYLMDEVDAHLDAQNTERLLSVLLRRSMDSQIIIVTLKDSTVAKANLVYGVYPKDGVSQVVKYNKNQKLSPNLQSSTP